jgi:hypothetical protein
MLVAAPRPGASHGTEPHLEALPPKTHLAPRAASWLGPRPAIQTGQRTECASLLSPSLCRPHHPSSQDTLSSATNILSHKQGQDLTLQPSSCTGKKGV